MQVRFIWDKSSGNSMADTYDKWRDDEAEDRERREKREEEIEEDKEEDETTEDNNTIPR